MLNAIKNIAGTLLATLQTRLALLGNELQVQKLVLAQQLALGLAVVFCLGLGVLLSLALLLVVWWEQRVLILSVSTAVFFLLAWWCYAALRRAFSPDEAVFGGTLAALAQDLEQLRGAAGQGAKRGTAGE